MAETEGPSTAFAGDSNPNAARNTMWGIFLISFIAAPLAILTAFAAFVCFSWGKISYKVLAGFVAFYAFVLLVTGNLVKSFESYVSSWQYAIRFIGERSTDVGPVIASMLVEQLPASILVGGFLGTVYSWWRYFRRPSWVEMDFRLTPWQVFKKHKNIKDIQSDKHGPSNGRTLGVNAKGEKIVQSEKEASAHTFVIGATGSGKTTTLLTGARDSIRRGEGFVFVDMKGSADVPQILAEYAERYGRKFYHWTSHDPRTNYEGPAKDGPAYYDPFGRGDATRKANLLMEGREWSEDHYKIIIHDYLQRALDIANGVPNPDIDSLADTISLLDPMELKKRSYHLVGDPYYDNIISEINRMTEQKMGKDVLSALEGMRKQLGILRDSIQGRWLRKDPTGQNDISLFDAAHKGAVVCFSIDSANYKTNSQILGDLIISDLQTVASELRSNPSRKSMNVIIDEFSAIGSNSILDLIARARDAGIPVTLSTQALGDLDAVSLPFMKQVTGIVSSFVIHRANRFEDAEFFAGIIGKEKKQVFRQSVEHTTSLFGFVGKGAGTGKGSVEVEEDYRVSPTDIQNLGTGEMVYLCKSPYRLEQVSVVSEDGKIVTSKDSSITAPVNWKPSAESMTSYMSDEDKEKYSVDPTLNGPVTPSLEKKPTYQSDDFSEWNHQDDRQVKHADPDAIRRIMGRKNLEEDLPESVDTSRPTSSVGEENPFPEPEEEAWNSPAPTVRPATRPAPRTERPQGLPAIPSRPQERHEDIDKLTSLPRVPKISKPANSRPIRPQRNGEIALPAVFPTPAKPQENRTPEAPKPAPRIGTKTARKETESNTEKGSFHVEDWDL